MPSRASPKTAASPPICYKGTLVRPLLSHPFHMRKGGGIYLLPLFARAACICFPMYSVQPALAAVTALVPDALRTCGHSNPGVQPPGKAARPNVYELTPGIAHPFGLSPFNARRSFRSGRFSSETGKGLRPAPVRRPPLPAQGFGAAGTRPMPWFPARN